MFRQLNQFEKLDGLGCNLLYTFPVCGLLGDIPLEEQFALAGCANSPVCGRSCVAGWSLPIYGLWCDHRK